MNNDPLPGEAIRDLAFDERHHKSLNSELKFLYTAITRAKCNLWMFESSRSKKAEPILEYWHKRNAMKRATVGTVKQNFLSPSTSSDSDWREQGDALRRRHIWSEACFCYARAGLEDRVRETQYDAIMTSIKISKEISSPHLQASLLLLQINENVTKIKYILQAAKLLTESHTPMYEEAARMFELQGRWNKAVECYKSAGSFENFARLHESKGNYDVVIEALLEKPFQNHLKALQTFLDYSVRKITVKTKFDKLVKRCADHYSTNKNTNALLEVLKHVNSSADKIKYLKKAEMYDEVIKHYMSTRSYSDIVDLAVAQGMVDKSFADDVKRAPNYYQFVFMKAKKFLINRDRLPLDKSLLVSELQQYSQDSKDEIQALSLLLIGMITSNDIEKARNYFRPDQNKAFQLEAFNQMTLLKQDIDMKTIQRYCQKSESLIKSLRLERSKFHQIALDETLWVYAIQKRGDHCVISKHGQLLMHFDDKSKKYDLDGMMCLSYQNLIDQLCDHFYACCQSWYDRCSMNTILLNEYDKYTEMFEQMTPAGSKSCGIDKFIQICLYMKEKGERECWLKIPSLFTFEVSSTLNVDSLDKIVANYLLLSKVREKIQTTVKMMISEKEANMNKWFHIWKLNCIFRAKILMRNKKTYFYVFQQWIELFDEKNILQASELLINFLKNVLSKQLIFSTQNIVDIITFHFMTLFGIVSRSRYNILKDCLSPSPSLSSFYFPSSYTCLEKLFNWFKQHSSSLDNKSEQDKTRAMELLTESLSLLIDGHDSPIEVTLELLDSTLSSKQCLILVLALLANLEIHGEKMAKKRHQILSILMQSSNKDKYVCKEVITVLGNSNSKVSDIFHLIVSMQASAFGDNAHLQMRYYCESQFNDIPVNPKDIVILSGTQPSSTTHHKIASATTPSSKLTSNTTTDEGSFSWSLDEFPSLPMATVTKK